jgi:hypothetical protein
MVGDDRAHELDVLVGEQRLDQRAPGITPGLNCRLPQQQRGTPVYRVGTGRSPE